MGTVGVMIACIFMLCGVVLAYDARVICKKECDLVKQNTVIKRFKIIGLALFVINGMLVILFI